ncbi:pentatricopeptide repeat-containing protein-like [Dorcoceras hygrometricum]|uniref:Pentatricopeptide repeat-containing protein-like n=1 Tax=Dorcoceras hygrometricum TaxID=472368 RepID=A0A2Z7CNH3_9LAMI|nr:pentatricopeptide repeat-containing protein-like [Dorcoceras hygrometricum]
MLKVFQSLESSGLGGFLGCSAAIYEEDLQEFFANAKVQNETVVRTVGGTQVVITENMFTALFKLPTEGLVAVTDSPDRMITQMKLEFSDSEHLQRCVKFGEFTNLTQKSLSNPAPLFAPF